MQASSLLLSISFPPSAFKCQPRDKCHTSLPFPPSPPFFAKSNGEERAGSNLGSISFSLRLLRSTPAAILRSKSSANVPQQYSKRESRRISPAHFRAGFFLFSRAATRHSFPSLLRHLPRGQGRHVIRKGQARISLRSGLFSHLSRSTKTNVFYFFYSR